MQCLFRFGFAAMSIVALGGYTYGPVYPPDPGSTTPMTPATSANTLNAVVGPGATIIIKKGNVKLTSSTTPLKAGKYKIVVDDKSRSHNFHLTDPKKKSIVKTTVQQVVKKTFNVTLVKGTYNFKCDPHANAMKGSFRVK